MISLRCFLKITLPRQDECTDRGRSRMTLLGNPDPETWETARTVAFDSVQLHGTELNYTIHGH